MLTDPGRLAALHASGLLGERDDALDRFAGLAARLLRAPAAMIVAVGAEEAVCCGAVGLERVPHATERARALCRDAAATGAPRTLDALDGVVCCAVPLHAPHGEAIGAVCAIGLAAHAWAPDDAAELSHLAAAVTSHLALREATREVAAERDRQRAALDAQLDAVVVMDEDGRIVEFNRAAERAFGYERDEALGRPMVELIVPERLRAAHSAGVAARLRDGAPRLEPRRVELPARRADGSEFPAELSVAALEAGGRRLFAGFIRDLSEVRAAQDALRASEERFRTLVETTPVVTYIADFDEAGGLRYVSPQIEAWTGYPARRFTEDPEFWRAIVHPDDRERVFATVARTAREERPFEAEYRLVAADGRIIHIAERDVIVRDEDGRPAFSQGVMLDITGQREAEAALADTEARLQLVAEGTPMILFAFDRNGVVTHSQGKGLELRGKTQDSLIGLDLFSTYADHPEKIDAWTRALAGEPVSIAYDFEGRVYDAYLCPTDDGVVGVAMDVTERRRSEERIAQLAYHDPLTGLPNRTHLRDRLQAELEHAEAAGTRVSLLYIDLDRFKLVNDALGHAAGDELLLAVVDRVRDAATGAGMLARYGGDEFVLLLDTDAAGAAEIAAERILCALERPFTLRDAEFEIGACVGVAHHPEHGATPEELLEHADAAMYQAKRAGRRRVHAYRAEAADGHDRLTLTARLRRALAESEFVLHFQPQFDLASGRPEALEALIRWEHPERGLVLPGEFVPHAEETGLIEAIGAWVIEAVCDQAAAWRRLALYPKLSFNVAPPELRRPDLVDSIAAAIASRDLDPAQFCVEVTESAALEDLDGALGAVARLRALGLQTAVDDFGANQSSLGRLRLLPVDVLKIDRAFLPGVPHDAQAAAIVSAVLTLASGLGLQAVAEGVENQDQRRFLISEGCQLGQGFGLARPMPAVAATRLLLEHAQLGRGSGAPSWASRRGA